MNALLNNYQKYINYIAAIFCVIVWGSTFANTRSLLHDFSSLEIMLIRFGLAWLALFLLAFVKDRKSIGWSGRNEWLFAAIGFTGVFAYQFLENCAIYYTNASNVALLVSVGPIITAIFSHIFLGEDTLSPRVLAGSLIAMCGAAIIGLNGVVNFEMRPIGDLMALGAMICWGAYSVLIVKAERAGLSPTVITRKSFSWALLIMSPIVIWGMTEHGCHPLDGSFNVALDLKENIERFSRPMNLMNLSFLGLLSSAVTFVLWTRACAGLGVAKTSICLYLEPVFAVMFSVIFLGESLSLMSTIGGITIITGLYLANQRCSCKNKNTK
jgi:drug/metabolite transporter (DMT)-like permease